ncbi:glycosyltransferase family 2 protein [Colwellia sp. C1TZA3]|uniref:glycosyltransferase family 2 protein n=1 Tax=Colwellia sp. C1TZA3 TaxID=2508879 RepID=UPI00174ABB50|nr:glycosyltransferase [Colwellia sp. C1TZA3]
MTLGTQPLVSVVIPVYNRAHIISRALDSVIAQNYANIEIILVDDCSCDSLELQEVLKQYSNVDLTYIRHKTNLHGSAARNTGIARAKGEYIALLDSDDNWCTSKIEVCLRTLSENDVDFVYSQVQKIGVQKGIVPLFPRKANETYSDYLLVRNGSIQTSTLFLKRSVFDKIQFDENLVRFQDYDFVLSLELIKATSFFIPEVLVYMYDDDQAGRISNSFDYQPAVYWHNKVKYLLSKRAANSFLVSRICQYMIYSGKRLTAMSILFNPVVFLYTNKSFWSKVLLVLLVPRQLLLLIKLLIYRLKNTTKALFNQND